MTDFTPLDAARRYVHLLSSGAGPDELAELFDPDVAVFLEFKGGRIVRQRNYDCFDPW